MNRNWDVYIEYSKVKLRIDHQFFTIDYNPIENGPHKHVQLNWMREMLTKAMLNVRQDAHVVELTQEEKDFLRESGALGIDE